MCAVAAPPLLPILTLQTGLVNLFLFKIIFIYFLKKIYYINIYLSEKHFEKQLSSHSQISHEYQISTTKKNIS